MSTRREIWYRATIGSLLLAVAGCDGAPATGEKVNAKPDEATKKKSLDGYMKKSMGGRKGQPAKGES